MPTKPVLGRKRAQFDMSKNPPALHMRPIVIKHRRRTSSSSVIQTAPTGSVQAVVMKFRREAMARPRIDKATGIPAGGNSKVNPVRWVSLARAKSNHLHISCFCSKFGILHSSFASSAVVYRNDRQPDRDVLTVRSRMHLLFCFYPIIRAAGAGRCLHSLCQSDICRGTVFISFVIETFRFG